MFSAPVTSPCRELGADTGLLNQESAAMFAAKQPSKQGQVFPMGQGAGLGHGVKSSAVLG